MQGLKRTHMCGVLDLEHAGEKVVIMGWVQRIRDLGGVIFLDLRDRTGIVQIVADSNLSQEAFQKAECIRNEYVIAVKGKVVKRKEETVNPKIKTGKIEVVAESIEV